MRFPARAIALPQLRAFAAPRTRQPGCRCTRSVDNCQQLLYVVNVPKGKHSKKEIENALQYVESNGWTVEQTARGHRWGVARCGHGCTVSIWSTPKNPGNHAKQIRRAVDRRPHQEDNNG